MGVNSQRELTIAERTFQEARRFSFLDDGVSMTAPETVYFAWDTQIDPGVTIEPNCRVRARREGHEGGDDQSLQPYRRGPRQIRCEDRPICSSATRR